MVRAFFPGTFDPIHLGHINIALRASRLFDELVVGVYDRPLKNLLFSPEDRLSLVRASFENEPKIRVMGYAGLTVDACRSIDAQVIVRGLRVFSDFEYEFRMALANHRLAPDIEVIALITYEEHTFLIQPPCVKLHRWEGISAAWCPNTCQTYFAGAFMNLAKDKR